MIPSGCLAFTQTKEVCDISLLDNRRLNVTVHSSHDDRHSRSVSGAWAVPMGDDSDRHGSLTVARTPAVVIISYRYHIAKAKRVQAMFLDHGPMICLNLYSAAFGLEARPCPHQHRRHFRSNR